MNNLHSSVTSKYQVTIPQEIRQYFNEIKPFSKVLFTMDKDKKSIIIKPGKNVDALIGILPSRKYVKNPKQEAYKIMAEEYRKRYGKVD